MQRRIQILEAMGLGPVWQLRHASADAHASARLDSSISTSHHQITVIPEAKALRAPDSTASWDTLQATVATCTRCRLCETRTQAVFGRGNPNARWMLIGEAPGEQEDRQGLPFVGRAGKLLDNMLTAIGLDRNNDVYIANVIKCRPPSNRNPAIDEIAACENYLTQQLHFVQPTLLLALGRFAAHTLLKTEAPILQLRGKVHYWQHLPLIVTYHPAYLLRNLSDKAKVWQDLVFAQRTYRMLLSQSYN